MTQSATITNRQQSYLSARQRRTLNEIQRFIDERGFPPTVEELLQRLEMTRAIVQGCLDKLIQKGILRKEHGKARGLELVRSSRVSSFQLVPVPLVEGSPGNLASAYKGAHSGHVFVSAEIAFYDECFAMKIVGDSMQRVGICDGDVVIVRKQPLAEPGKIIVAAINGEVTVRRLEYEKGRFLLLPENDGFSPIEVDAHADFQMFGMVIAVGHYDALNNDHEHREPLQND